ncbi:MAG TPA: tetratricopeptide repeat protein, partial [Solirubrobacteraceae bacterium]|nr:tetratricopeptide repeat protein [Solirubrobacteraceae bacterium]
MEVVTLQESSDRDAVVGQRSVAEAIALLADAQALFDDGRHSETLVRCDEALQRFGEDLDSVVRERVAYGLLLKGLSLARLGHSDDAIGVYEGLIDRAGGSADAKTRRHVAWAFNNRAFMLKELGRGEQSIAAYNELIDQFGDERNPEIRLRVSWALWNKADSLRALSRVAESDGVYDELIARRDEGLNLELDRNIAWCLRCRAWNLWGAGAKEQAVEAYDEPLKRFGNASDGSLRMLVFDSLSDKAAVLVQLGRFEEAISAYDESLALLARRGETQSQVGEAAAITLLLKGELLWSVKRLEEAIVVFDGAVEAYHQARAAGAGTDAAWAAMLAVFYKVSRLCALDRSAEAGRARDQLIAVLGDVGEASPADERSDARETSEQDLAASFAEVINDGDCWRWFDTTDDELPRDTMAERAIDLYRLTEPWALADDDAACDAAQFAAAIVRDIADGYAMLTRPVTADQRRSMPFPQRAESARAQLIRTFGADTWAAKHGHPLLLPEPDQDAENTDRCEGQPPQAGGRTPEAFLRFFLTAAYTHDLVALACDSRTVRQALRDARFGQRAAQQISEARRWARRVTIHMPPEAAGVAIASLLMNQAFFVASQGAISSSADLFPATALLRDC